MASTRRTLLRFPGEFSRRCVLFLEVFRKLSIEPEKISRNFSEQFALRNSGFFYFQSGCCNPVPKKGSDIMSEEKENKKRKYRYFQQGRHYSNPPPPVEPPVCMRSPLCKGCPFPGNGFICWSEDGTCMRTRLQKTKGGASHE